MIDAVIVFPVFNEEQVIKEFVDELNGSFYHYKIAILVVNDFSTDSTELILNKLKRENKIHSFVTNSKNLGHGPSTIKALQLATKIKANQIISMDGDGEIDTDDLCALFEFVKQSKTSYVEGIRTQRKDALYRKFISKILTYLVLLKTGRKPLDANTPFRGYTKSGLKQFLSHIPENSQIPNLLISVLARGLHANINEFPLKVRIRNRQNSLGTTWNASHKQIPTQKFLTFCTSAFGELVSFKNCSTNNYESRNKF